MAKLFCHMEHWPLPPRLWPAQHHHCRHRFSTRVQQGYYIKGVKIKVPTVAKAVSYINTSIHLVGISRLFKTMEENYILPVRRLIEGLCCDPPHPYHTFFTPYQRTCRKLGTYFLLIFIISCDAVNTPHPGMSSTAIVHSIGTRAQISSR